MVLYKKHKLLIKVNLETNCDNKNHFSDFSFNLNSAIQVFNNLGYLLYIVCPECEQLSLDIVAWLCFNILSINQCKALCDFYWSPLKSFLWWLTDSWDVLEWVQIDCSMRTFDGHISSLAFVFRVHTHLTSKKAESFHELEYSVSICSCVSGLHPQTLYRKWGRTAQKEKLNEVFAAYECAFKLWLYGSSNKL